MLRTTPAIRFVFALSLAACLGCGEDEQPLGTASDDGIDTTGVPIPTDTNPPQAVSDIALDYSPATNTATVTWNAPMDDTADERVARYEIRFAHTVGYPPVDFWDLSPVVDNPPAPVEPGEVQTYALVDPKRATDLYVGVRAIDEAGNRSAPGEIESVSVPGVDFAGQCRDVYTQTAVAELDVRLTGGKWADLETGAGGGFAVANVTPGILNVEIRSGANATDYHRLKEALTIDGDFASSFVMIPIQRLTPAQFAEVSLLKLYRNVTNTDMAGRTVLAKWHERPIPCYIPPYVSKGGIDYEFNARRAAQRWMDATGEPLFCFVDEPPDTGVVVKYPSHESMGILVGITMYTTGDDGHPIRDEIRVVNEFADEEKLYRVFLHEFGHTLRFGHVNDRSYIMYGSAPLPPDIHPDEIQMTKLHEALPTRIDMKIYNQSLSR